MRVDETQYQEEQQAKLIGVGDFRFEIEKASEKPNPKSKDGKQWSLVLGVYSNDDKRHRVKATVANWKNGGASHLKSFFDSIGLDWHDEHEVEDVVGLRGMVHTKAGEWQGEPKDEVHYWIGALPNQNIVLPKDNDDSDDEFKTVSDDEIPF
jgi:hypothetical protein